MYRTPSFRNTYQSKALIFAKPTAIKFRRFTTNEEPGKFYDRGFQLKENNSPAWAKLISLIGFGLTAAVVYDIYKTKTQADDGERDKSPSMSKKALEMGASAVQNFDPVNSIHAHLCGIHFYSGDLNRQVEAHHYCTHLSDDIQQCVIYDSNKKHARLIGIEYIISERIFKTLPEEEQKLWHSHATEVRSGTLVAPRLPDIMEAPLMSELVTTYGKTFHTWQVDRGDLVPLGIPQLMMSITSEDQINKEVLRKRDIRLGIDSKKVKDSRSNLEAIKPNPKADAWLRGEVIQLKTEKVNMKK
jgi:hypothetical protein